MRSQKIIEGEIKDMLISSLPTRPTAPEEFGGKGYTAAALKAVFDALPLLLVDKYNLLLEDLFTGEILEAIIFEGETLGNYLRRLRSDIDSLLG